jgi:hypothetical protein
MVLLPMSAKDKEYFMVLNRNDISAMFARRQKKKTTLTLTWKGLRKVKLLDKSAVLHDIWRAFCREFDEQHQFLEEEVANMRQQIEAKKEKSDADLVVSAPGYVFEELRVLFKELEKELDGQLTHLSGGKSSILERIHLVLEQDYDGQLQIVDQTEKTSLEHMERLSRRLERMATDLQLSEEEVARLRGELTVAYDCGVASVYKSVQGLSNDETNVESKRDMLSKLFEANLEIRNHPI